jgi:transposase
MDEFELPAGELKHLRIQHRAMKKKRDADRIKAIVLLGSGWTAAQVCEALLLDQDTIRRYRTRYEQGGLQDLLQDRYKGKQSKLDDRQLAELSAHLQAELYMTVQEVIVYVKRQYKVSYGISGMTGLLHRLGFVYKKPKVVPGKADPQAQRAFLERYVELKETKGENDPIYFMDGTHPQHNTMGAYG